MDIRLSQQCISSLGGEVNGVMIVRTSGQSFGKNLVTSVIRSGYNAVLSALGEGCGTAWEWEAHVTLDLRMRDKQRVKIRHKAPC